MVFGKRTLLAALAVLGLAAAVTSFAGASFTAQSTNAGNALSADTTSNYLGIYSQVGNPGGLTGYAVRKGMSPSTPAASGTNDDLAVNLGGYNDVNATNANRVLTLTTPAALPSGVTSVTVALSVVADPTTGIQPISDYNIATTSNSSPAKTVTLGAGTTRQVNLAIKTKGLTGNLQYVPQLVVQVTFNGYSGGFLSYVVPVKVYDGTGAGPN